MSEEKKEKLTHSMMPKKLAEALMENAVQHFAFGGIAKAIGGGVQSIAGGLTKENKFTAEMPNITRQQYLPQIQQQQQRQNDIFSQQQGLAQQLLAQSQGQGPNPAQAALAQSTGQNAQMQAALMASQRGASANPALMARQAAMQGANVQQQGVGQAATMQAQQQLAAQQALNQLYQQTAQNSLQAEQMQQAGLQGQNQLVTQGSLGTQGLNQLTMGQNAAAINQTSGSIMQSAGNMLGMSDENQKKDMKPAGMDINAFLDALSNQPKMSLGGMAYPQDNMLWNQADPTGASPALQPATQTTQGAPMAQAPQAQPSNPVPANPIGGGGGLGVSFNLKPPTEGLMGGGKEGGGGGMMSMIPMIASMFSDERGKKDMKDGGGDIQSMMDNLSPKSYEYKDTSLPGTAEGERYGIVAQDLEKSAAGSSVVKDTPQGKMVDPVQGFGLALAGLAELNRRLRAIEGQGKQGGGMVPGKAKVKGDSEKNDTVPAMLSPGEIVLPKSVVESKDAAKKSAEFVASIKGGQKLGYGGVVKARKAKGKKGC